MPRTANKASKALTLPVGGALAMLLLHSALGISAADDVPDPLPIQRVLIAPDQLSKEMQQRIEQRVLVQMPRGDFEDLVRKAAKAQAPKNGPRLIEARYRATLVDNGGGLSGTGQWKVLHPGSGPALLPLQPLNLALQKPRFENRDALVADFDGKTPALLVDDGGEHSVAIEWSARADPRPEGLYFALELPAAPVASLELDLPADREASVAGGAVLSGPYPSEAADRRLWKIACGGRPGVNLWVRRSRPAASSGPTLFVRQHTMQTLVPEGLNATYQFDLEVTRPGVRFLACEIDGDLRPTEIVLANLEKSEFKAGSGAAPSLLLLTLREPLAVGQESLQIRGLAPLGTAIGGARDGRAVAWTSPGIHLTQVGFEAGKADPAARVVPRGETLEVRCHPDVRMEDFRPGAYRLTDAAPHTDPDSAVAFEVLTLLGGGVEVEGTPAGKTPRRPAARLHSGGVDFRARQAAWWQVADDRMSLTLQITYHVTQGQLFQLPVQLPPDWEIEGVELNPADQLRNWNIHSEKAKSTLLVDLQRPVTATDGTPGRPLDPILTVRLNGSRRESLANRPLPFPDAVPLGARLREGSLAIDYSDVLFKGEIKATAVESDAGEDEAPWGPQAPDHFFPYRGQAPQGTLTLRPRPARLRAACASDVYLAANRVDTRLMLEAEAGSVRAVDVYLSAPAVGGAHWQVEAGGSPLRQAERLYPEELAALATARDLGGVTGALTARRGEYWRLTFAQPLRGHTPLVLHLSQPLAPLDGRWEAALPVVLNAAYAEGEVTLHLAGANRLSLETAGLHEVAPAVPAGARNKGGTAWRTFRYGPDATPHLSGTLPPRRGTAAAVIERAELTTFVHTDGGLEHHFDFSLANWPGATLPLPLPAGCRPVAVRVDGRWLPRPASADNAAQETVLELPVPAGDRSGATHQFAVVYASAAAPWSWWTRAESPRPPLPVEPLAYRHTWRLPPGVSPLDETSYRRLPGPGEGFEPIDPRRWTPADRPLFRVPLWSTATKDTEAGQRQALADAVQAVRRGNASQTLPLAEVLERVAAELARDGRALVLDAEALRAAGLTPRTLLAIRSPTSADDAAAPWDGLGLAVVVGRPALLLTTDRQLSVWREAAPAGPLSDTLAGAVTAAAAQGQDASGRFRSALASGWDLSPSDEYTEGRGETLAEWTAWEALPGTDPDTSLLVVRGEEVTRMRVSLSLMLGVGLGVLLGLVGWRLRPWGRWRLVPLLVWLALAGLGVLFLPSALQYLAWGPLLGGSLAFFVWYIIAAVQRRPLPPAPSARTGVIVTAVGLALAVGILGPTGRAEPPKPYTVLLVGPADAPDKQTALVPPDLRAELQKLSKPPVPASGAVLLSAEYEGKVVDDIAEFAATFAVQCFGDEQVTLTLPLDGVQLFGEALLDGAQANPVALAAPLTGFALKNVGGAGRHKVELHFRVPVTGTPDDRNVQFTAPRLTQNRLRLKLPKDAGYFQSLVRYGAQRVTAADDGPLVEVDLGRVATPLHLRWFHEQLPPRPAKVSCKEAYLWDLRADTATLTALLHYEIEDGPVTALTVLLPPELEVRGAEARRPLTSPGGAVRLRDYRIDPTANPRVMELHFAAPVRGEVQVQLDLVPAAPLPAQVTLPLPAPQGARGDGGYLAYRVQGLEATRTDYLRVRGVPPGDFAPFWPVATRPDAAAPADAYFFRREGGQGPVLTLRLKPQTLVRAAQELSIRVGPRQARVQAGLDLVAPNKDLALVEWEIQSPQPFTVAGITGDDVRAWSQTGNRVQVWLKHAGIEKTHLDLSGWLSLVPDNQRQRLELPTLRVVSARSQQTTVRLTAAPGLAFAPPQPRNLTAQPDAGPAGQELAYQTSNPNYGGNFWVQPAATGPEVRVVTVVEARDGRLTFTAALDYHPRGDLRTVNIRLSDWDGEDVRLDAPRVAQRRGPRRTADGRSWTLDLQPGTTGTFRPTLTLAAGIAARLAAPAGDGHYRCTLSGSVLLADVAGGVRMPRVTVGGSRPAEYFLVLAGQELTPEAASGLTALPNPAQALAAWKDVPARDAAAAWKVADAEWKLRLQPRLGPAETGPVVVFLTEQTAAVVDGRHFLHAAEYTFRHEAGAELNVTLPDGARLVSAALDGVALTPLPADTTHLALPLPSRAGVRRLHLGWVYDAGREPLTAPNLDRPHLDGARDGPVLYTLLVPPGFETTGTDLKPGLARAAALDLAEASAQLAVSQALGDQRPTDTAALADAQKRFAASCRRAERALAATGDKGESDRPGAVQLKTMRDTNRDLARRLGYEDVRTAAENQAGTASHSWPTDAGIPLFAVVQPDGTLPHLTLQAVRERQDGRSRLAAVAWLTLLGLVGLLACFRGLVSVARLFWPEQVLLLGAAAWFVAGPTLLALLLVILGVAARGAYVTGGLRRLLARPHGKPAPSSHGSANRSGT